MDVNVRGKNLGNGNAAGKVNGSGAGERMV
jgi:hypothetical protein